VRVISGSTLPDALGSTAPLALAGDFTIEIGMTADVAGGGGFGVFYGGPDGGKAPYNIELKSDGSVLFQMYGGTGGSSFLTTAAGAFEFGIPHTCCRDFRSRRRQRHRQNDGNLCSADIGRQLERWNQQAVL